MTARQRLTDFKAVTALEPADLLLLVPSGVPALSVLSLVGQFVGLSQFWELIVARYRTAMQTVWSSVFYLVRLLVPVRIAPELYDTLSLCTLLIGLSFSSYLFGRREGIRRLVIRTTAHFVDQDTVHRWLSWLVGPPVIILVVVFALPLFVALFQSFGVNPAFMVLAQVVLFAMMVAFFRSYYLARRYAPEELRNPDDPIELHLPISIAVFGTAIVGGTLLGMSYIAPAASNIVFASRIESLFLLWLLLFSTALSLTVDWRAIPRIVLSSAAIISSDRVASWVFRVLAIDT